MSAYRYYCGQCRTVSDPVYTRGDADAEGAEHRAIFHGRHHPVGERIVPVRGQAARIHGARYVSTPGALAVIGLLILVSLIARVMG